ncbi:MAG: NAD-dependent epimerase/dehydratase family protein [Planctomycetes bacterium]|nr:NAD-dependent epimerase/dehydratase family protein [Planctomycetota bacterium]
MKTPPAQPTRRSFLTSTLAAGAALPLVSRLPAATGHRPAPKKILVLGGTGFLGPHFVRAALANGHTVTLFNRGKTNSDLFQELEKLRGDREKGDLEALQGREFDAVIDTSGYVPAHVEATAKLFAESAAHYQLISSISVYRAFGDKAETIDESADVAEVGDEDVAKVSTIRQSMPFYGALKARCEAAAEAAMPGKVANIRPGLIVGPGDNSDRFTWWPVRIDKGGEVLCPGDEDGQVQFVDVRDLAEWMLVCAEQRVAGVFNCTGFQGRVGMRDVLSACKCATSVAVTLTFVSEEFLRENEVGAWMQMPLWIPREGRTVVANRRAIDKGLRFRPIADTVRDTLHWAKTERGDKPFARTGIEAEREQQLLAKWHSAAKSRATGEAGK